jgi:hypothetical protein
MGTPNSGERSSKSIRVGSKVSAKTVVNEWGCGFPVFFGFFYGAQSPLANSVFASPAHFGYP